MTTKTIPKDPQKVARIMQAAVTTFAHQGYQGAKTETIAAAAQVSKGLIFHYYGNKQALYFATVAQATQTIVAEVQSQTVPVPNDLVSLVIQSAKYKAAFGRTHPDEMRLMIEAYGELQHFPVKLQQQIQGLYQQTMTISRRLIGQVIDRMALRPELDREVTIDLIMGVMNQLLVEFQAQMKQMAADKAKHVQSMDDVQWLVQRAQAYMQILEMGFVTPK